MKAGAGGDFASAAMVRVLLRGMAKLNLHPPAVPADLLQATLALDLKRAVVRSALEQGGWACLPLLGRGLHDLAMEPTHLALTSGRSASTLFLRWQRLERYIHSRHRVRVLELADSSLHAVHEHRDRGPRPLPAEDLVVCGVLCALLEANGLQSVKAQALDCELYPRPDPQKLAQRVQACQTETWTFTWQSGEGPGHGFDASTSWMQVAPPSWSQLACAAGDLVARELPQLLALDMAAEKLGLARRSFQRALASEGLNYTRLVAEVRCRLVGWSLLHSTMPVAEVGFVCGYSDQAHLTREFKRHVGIPPAKYRDMFAVS